MGTFHRAMNEKLHLNGGQNGTSKYSVLARTAKEDTPPGRKGRMLQRILHRIFQRRSAASCAFLLARDAKDLV